jgi:signal transduction histidine kinase
MKKVEPREWLPWTAVLLLAALCSLLAILQYRWIGEIRDSERDRMRRQLQAELDQVSRSFDTTLASAAAALSPTAAQVAGSSPAAAYGVRYLKWRDENPPLFSRIGIATPDGSDVTLSLLDLSTGKFSQAEWPTEWSGAHSRIESHIGREPAGGAGGDSAVFEVPRFGLNADGGVREQDWLILQVDVSRVRAALLPELLNRSLAHSGKLDYDVEVVDRSTQALVFQTSGDARDRIGENADGSVGLFDTRQIASVNLGDIRGGRRMGGDHFGSGPGAGRRGPPPNERRGPPHEGRREPPPDFGDMGGRRVPPPLMAANAPHDVRWMLLARHQAGSLEAAVAKIRLRNMAASGGLLLLIIATATMMVRSSRQAAKLARLQMNFVAGVSHELRTPLTVIRTAAYNLRGRIGAQPQALERYGKLIQDESEKLTRLVEQVLQFAAARSGSLVKKPTPVPVEELIEDSLEASARALADPTIVVEKHIASDLPLVLADGPALRHAIQNLIENAVKYGGGEQHWVGVSAAAPGGRDGQWVEIRVADRGPGIPSNEQSHIFEPFIRGRRAVEDQIHGTGLGLNLVKTIVAAHGGSIAVHSSPQTGTEFVIRIPAAPAGTVDEFANTTG